MKSPLSPCDINVLLHCHVSPEPHPAAGAPAVKESYDMFKKSGLIVRNNNAWVTTAKGDAFVAALCRTPEPVAIWAIPAIPQYNLPSDF